MPSLAQSESFMRLSLVAPYPAVQIAASTLAKHLKIDAREAAYRLAAAPSTLCKRMEVSQAHRLANLLGAMGVQIKLDPITEGAAPIEVPEALFDLSIQPLQVEKLDRLSKSLVRWLPLLALTGADRDRTRIEAALTGPGGLILSGQTREQIRQIRSALRRVNGLLVAVSNPQTALFDLLRDPNMQSPNATSLKLSLQRLGLVSCPLTGAIAARLDQATCAHVMTRFPNCGLIALNRDFQRFDLFLTGAQNVSPRDLADFLMTRSDLPRQTLEQMPRPLKIESGLTRANALAFQTDYAALGLQTSARLRMFYPIRQIPSADRVGS